MSFTSEQAAATAAASARSSPESMSFASTQQPDNPINRNGRDLKDFDAGAPRARDRSRESQSGTNGRAWQRNGQNMLGLRRCKD
ncbi:hypothetical protein PG990_006737 [Apiospora arundinis]